MTIDKESLEFGREGERIVERFLMSRGAMVSPLSQYEKHDKAPVLILQENDAIKKLIHPDLMVFTRDRGVLFAEVKRKNRWVGPFNEGRRDRGQETGFDTYQLEHYARVSDRTGLPLWVFFVHERQPPTGIYAQELAKMLPHLRPWDGRDERTGQIRYPAHMALFPQHCLIKLWDLETVEPRPEPEPIGEIRLPPRKPEPQGSLF
jgi:hypothetical protein